MKPPNSSAHNGVTISAYTATSALGLGKAAHAAALRAGRSCLSNKPWESCTLATWVGEAPGVNEVQISGADALWDCRNNHLARLGLRQDGFLDAVADARRGWRAAGVVRLPAHAQPVFHRAVHTVRTGPVQPCADHFHRLFVERQGIRLGPARHAQRLV